MAEVDAKNKIIESYSVRHHKFDPETNHFRWFLIKAFDNELEMNSLLETMVKDLDARRRSGESHPKEQVVGSIYNPKEVIGIS